MIRTSADMASLCEQMIILAIPIGEAEVLFLRDCYMVTALAPCTAGQESADNFCFVRTFPDGSVELTTSYECETTDSADKTSTSLRIPPGCC